MKILHTSEFYYPSVGGMQEVVKQISEHLVRLGHEVTVATSKISNRSDFKPNGVFLKEFDISGNIVYGFQGEIEAYQQFLLSSDFDIVTNFAAQQCFTDLMLLILEKVSAKKVLVPTGFSGLHNPSYSVYFERMKNWMKQYDMNVFQSRLYQDYIFGLEAGIENIIIIPNGASKDEFLTQDITEIRGSLKIPKNHFLILHVGSHTNFKGHAEAIRIFKGANLNNTTFIIIGNVFSRSCYSSCKLKELFFRLNLWNRLKGRRLMVRSLSRKETVSLFKTADLFLFPSNIECSPLVLFECMASKTPFLTTDVGNSREIIDWSHAGELLPTTVDECGYSHADIDCSIKMLEDLYRNPSKRAIMQENGYIAWQEKFNWEVIAKAYEKMYIGLLEDR